MNNVHYNLQRPLIVDQLLPHIKSRRLALGLSQITLAQRASVSRTTLCRLENGGDTPVQTDVIERVLGVLGLSPRLDWTPGGDPQRLVARLREQIRVQDLRERHLRLALDLATRPLEMKAQVNAARAQVALWARNRTCSPHYIRRWSKLLSLPLPEMGLKMAGLGEWSNAMFQNSPWSGAWS